MSWIKIAKLNLSDTEIESILDSIKAKHSFFGKWSKQSWGWSAECDISKYNNKIIFSGAEYSRGCNLPERFKKEARKRGYYHREINPIYQTMKGRIMKAKNPIKIDIIEG